MHAERVVAPICYNAMCKIFADLIFAVLLIPWLWEDKITASSPDFPLKESPRTRVQKLLNTFIQDNCMYFSPCYLIQARQRSH